MRVHRKLERGVRIVRVFKENPRPSAFIRVYLRPISGEVYYNPGCTALQCLWDNGVSQNGRSPVGQAVNGLAEVAQGAGSALFPPVDVRERGLQGGKGRSNASFLPEPGR